MLVPIVPVHAKFVKVLCTVSNNPISHNSNTPVGRRFPKLFLGMFHRVQIAEDGPQFLTFDGKIDLVSLQRTFSSVSK